MAAGVRPTLEGREGSAEQWLGDVVATLRGAIFQITQGAAPELDAQQIVDLAYALAQMEGPLYGPLIRRQLYPDGQSSHEITAETSSMMDKYGDSD